MMNLKKAFVTLALAAASATASASIFHLTGDVARTNDVVKIAFTLSETSAVRVWTDFYQDGADFDPGIALWNGDGSSFLTTNEYGEEAHLIVDDLTDSDWNTGFTIAALNPDSYFLTLFGWPNRPKGQRLENGFELDDADPYGGASHWSLWLEGVTSATGPNPTSVPEPASLALLGVGLAGLAASRKRKAAA